MCYCLQIQELALGADAAGELVAAPKRVRRKAEVDAAEEEEGNWGESGDDSEWEPDWKSDNDDDITGFPQVVPLLRPLDLVNSKRPQLTSCVFRGQSDCLLCICCSSSR